MHEGRNPIYTLYVYFVNGCETPTKSFFQWKYISKGLEKKPR